MYVKPHAQPRLAGRENDHTVALFVHFGTRTFLNELSQTLITQHKITADNTLISHLVLCDNPCRKKTKLLPV